MGVWMYGCFGNLDLDLREVERSTQGSEQVRTTYLGKP